MFSKNNFKSTERLQKKGKHLQKKVPSWKQKQIEKEFAFGLEKEKASNVERNEATGEDAIANKKILQ
jgi:hypothetical protein